MRITSNEDRLNVSELEQLTAANSRAVQRELGSALTSQVRGIDLDLSQTRLVDCCGIGALIALRNQALKGNPGLSIRLFNATAAAQRVFRLTQTHCLFALAPVVSQ